MYVRVSALIAKEIVKGVEKDTLVKIKIKIIIALRFRFPNENLQGFPRKVENYIFLIILFEVKC